MTDGAVAWSDMRPPSGLCRAPAGRGGWRDGRSSVCALLRGGRSACLRLACGLARLAALRCLALVDCEFVVERGERDCECLQRRQRVARVHVESVGGDFAQLKNDQRRVDRRRQRGGARGRGRLR